MSGNVILDVAIGLIFVYLLLSLMCSALQELLATVFKLRAKNLEAGIRNLLDDPNAKGVADQLLAHPLIKKLAKKGKKPSYIPSRTFALALMDSIKDPNTSGSPIALAKTSVSKLPKGELQVSLLVLIEDAEGDVEKIRNNIESWFDDKMDRASGWYKRKAKLFMFGIAMVLAVVLNVDSIHVATTLWKDQGLRQALVTQAQGFSATEQASGLPYSEIKKELGSLKLPIGWGQRLTSTDSAAANKSKPKTDNEQNGLWTGVVCLFGWLITALCVSLGAPFWFDALGKALSVRAAGKKPERSSAST